VWVVRLCKVTIALKLIILYINSLSLSVSQSVEVLKPRSLLIKLSPWTRGPKNYSGPRVVTSYFYFYVRFRAATAYFYFYVRFRVATAVVDGGGIFGIWRVGEEIWVRFFWAAQQLPTFTFTSVSAQQLPSSMGEVFLGFGGWVRRFGCAFFGPPNNCLLLLLRPFSCSNCRRRWGRYFWDLEGGWRDLSVFFLG
jgi:hypothetical protein